MRHRYALALIGLAALSFATPHSTERRMFPRFVVMRGGGLSSPIVLKPNIAAAAGIGVDSIGLLYGSLDIHVPKDPGRVRRGPSVEVAEFFGPKYVWAAEAPAFDSANHHSRIYLPANGEPALWENPVVAPGSAQRAFYKLGESVGRQVDARVMVR